MLGDEDEPGNIKLTFEQLHNLLAVALKEGHRKERKKFTLSDEDIFDLFDEKPGLFTEVLELFAASLTRTFQGDEEKNSQALKAAKAKSAK